MNDKLGKKIYFGAIILGAGTFISKLLGAAYRIPLTKIIGTTGLGLYQMIFPIYTLLLEFSGAGVPSAVSKLIASYKGTDKERYSKNVLFTCLIFFSALGLILSLLTAIGSKAVSSAQGDINAYIGYIFLSPSIFIVCVISCFRGYFQGYMNMTPTALSQITEQVVKLAVGLLLADFFMPNVVKAVAGITFAITFSEIVAALQLFIAYRLREKKNSLNVPYKYDIKEFPLYFKQIIFYAIPVALLGLILPVSKAIDSFVIINLLKEYSGEATGIYGLYSGVVFTVIGLPVAICYGIATVAIPAVSSSQKKAENKYSLKTIFLTIIVSIPCAAFIFLFPSFIVNILFGYLSDVQKTTCINLLKISSPCVILLSVLQTVNAVLIAKGSPFKPILGLSLGVAVKTVAEIILLKNSNINIYGAAIGSIACYFVADLVNLSMIFFNVGAKDNESKRIKNRQYVGT